MDIDKYEDDLFATIAGTFVDTDTEWEFDNLLEEVNDIYELIYHPKYAKMTQNMRKLQKCSLECILVKCHTLTGLKLNKPVNEKVIPKSIYSILLNSRYDIKKFEKSLFK